MFGHDFTIHSNGALCFSMFSIHVAFASIPFLRAFCLMRLRSASIAVLRLIGFRITVATKFAIGSVARKTTSFLQTRSKIMLLRIQHSLSADHVCVSLFCTDDDLRTGRAFASFTISRSAFRSLTTDLDTIDFDLDHSRSDHDSTITIPASRLTVGDFADWIPASASLRYADEQIPF